MIEEEEDNDEDLEGMYNDDMEDEEEEIEL